MHVVGAFSSTPMRRMVMVLRLVSGRVPGDGLQLGARVSRRVAAVVQPALPGLWGEEGEWRAASCRFSFVLTFSDKKGPTTRRPQIVVDPTLFEWCIVWYSCENTGLIFPVNLSKDRRSFLVRMRRQQFPRCLPPSAVALESSCKKSELQKCQTLLNCAQTRFLQNTRQH